ncbi:MAG: hypothetical protein BIFFINMI_01532 [Phycisphaerae bacterium]|nr:hypothetical protein [Phycisphaerae bacterium]
MNSIEQRYLRAIQARVCRNCVDLMADGTCGVHDRVCPVERNLKQILQVVNRVKSDSVEPYLLLLRREVCANCEHEDMAGECTLRNEAGCALDRYFVLIIDAIEEVRSQIRAEAQAAGAK